MHAERLVRHAEVKIRPVEKSDRQRIISLCAEIFQLDRGRLENVWSWLFDDNPAATALPVQGWVLEANGEIVGHSGVIAQRFCVSGREIVFSFATGFCVLPQYRFHGIRLAHEFLTHKQSAFPLTNSGNANTIAIYKFFGCQQIPGMANDDYVWVRRFDTVLRRTLGRDRDLKSAFARLFSSFLKWIGPALTYWVWGRHRSPYIVECCEQLDEGFERLWEALSRSYSLLGVRDRQYLTWRYFRHPERPYRLFAARNRDGEVVGYAVCWFGDQSSDLRTLHIVDLFCDHRNSELVRALLQKMMSEGQRLSADVVRIQNAPVTLRQVLKRRGFLRHKRDNRTAYLNNCGLPSEALSNGDGWYCATGDGDADIRIWPLARNYA